jgi:hypothetical protein
MRCSRDARHLMALSAIAASVLGCGPALAYCPTAAAARNGFVLVSEARGIRIEVQPSKDDMLTMNLIIGGKLQSTSTYYKGYQVTRIVYGSGATSTPTYDFDYAKDPPFAEGYHKAFRMGITLANGNATTLAVETTVVGHERISVGDCALDTLVVEARTDYADGSVQTRRTNFSPLLRTFVRTTFTNGNAPPSTTLFDRIEPAAAAR